MPLKLRRGLPLPSPASVKYVQVENGWNGKNHSKGGRLLVPNSLESVLMEQKSINLCEAVSSKTRQGSEPHKWRFEEYDQPLSLDDAP